MRLYETEVKLVVHNGGNKSAGGFYWEVLVSRDLFGLISFKDLAGEPIKTKFAPQSATDIYDKVDGHYNHKLFPYSGIPVVTMVVRTRPEKSKQFVIKWRIRGEDGLVPPEGLAELGFTKVEDEMFAVMAPSPGKKVDPVLCENPAEGGSPENCPVDAIGESVRLRNLRPL